MWHPFIPTRVSERKKTTASCGRDEEIGALLCGWCSHYVKQFIVHQRAKHRVTLGPNNCTFRYIPPKIIFCPYRNLYMSVHGNIIYNSPNLEKPKYPSSEWLNKIWYIQWHVNWQLNEVLIHATHGWTLKTLCQLQKTTLYDLYKISRIRQKVNYWLLGVIGLWRRWRMTANDEYGGFFWVMKMF